MIEWWWIPLIWVTGYANRFCRGLGKWDRWQWYFAMVGLAALMMPHSYLIVLIWTYILVAYAMFGWHAMFSATHGKEPTRADPWYTQWMQTISRNLARYLQRKGKIKPENFWFIFGIIYGTIRGALTAPGWFFLSGYLGSSLPLIGVPVMMSMGAVYYFSGRQVRALGFERGSVMLAEVLMGMLIGWLMLISRAAYLGMQ